MSTLTTANTKLILMLIFGLKKTASGKLKVSLSNVINYGKVEGDNIRFETKEGVKVKPITSFGSNFAIIDLSEVDLDNFMSKWSRLNKNNLPIVVDELIESNEVYKDDFSPLSIMIERRKTEIAIKPIFEEC